MPFKRVLAMAVEYSGYAGPFYWFFWETWWGEDFGELSRVASERPRRLTPAQAVFSDNFPASAFTAHGGTNCSTLPPRRAISFTILELR
jgi:hypothetical protein